MSSSSEPQISGNTKKIASHASWMALGTLSSRILGLMRDIIILNVFNRTVTDAYLVAFRLPNMVRRLFGEGSFSISLIPAYSKAKHSDSEAAKTLVRSFYSLMLFVITCVIAAGFIYMDELVGWLVSGDGYKSIPGKVELTVSMARTMFFYLFAISHFAFFMAILNAEKFFAGPAFAPCLFNLAVIGSALVPSEWQSYPGQALAQAVVVGGFLQAVVLIPQLIHIRIDFRPGWKWSPALSQALFNMLPSMLSMGIIQFTGLVNTYLSSQLGEGSHTWIYSADRLLEFPLSIIAVSIGSALLPTLSDFWSQNRKEDYVNTIAEYVSLNLFLSVPAALSLVFLAEPLVTLLFDWGGKMSAQDISSTAQIVQIYGWLLVSASVVRVFAPSFYSLGNTWWPAVSSGTGLVQHILLAPYLMELWGLWGLAFSVTLSATTNMLILLTVFQWKFVPVPWLSVFQGLLRMVPGFVLVSGLCFVCQMGIMQLDGGVVLKLTTLASIAFIVAAYFAVSQWLQVSHASRVTRRLLRRR